MPTTIDITQKPTFATPKWSVATAKPGDQIELQVTASGLLPEQAVHFEIRTHEGQVLARLKADGSGKKRWTVPSLPGSPKLHFLAILREKPGPQNGHVNRLRHLKSPDLEVQGARVVIKSIDAAFVPKQEKLEVKFDLAGEKPAKGCIEVWGERYPTDKPLYTEDFTPAVGEKLWKTWDGKSNDGEKFLSSTTADAYLTPEYSPYRLRIIVGSDEASIKVPFGSGVGKVCLAETQFEVRIQKVTFQVQHDIAEAATEDKYKLNAFLTIPLEPALGITNATNSSPIVITTASAHGLAEKDEVRITGVQGNTAANGNFVVRLVATGGDTTSSTKFTLHKDKNFANTTGNGAYTASTGKVVALVNRIPGKDQEARLRIPCARHTRIGESLNQGVTAFHRHDFTASSSGPEEFTLTGGKKIKPGDTVAVWVNSGAWTQLGGGYSQVGNNRIRINGGIASGNAIAITVTPAVVGHHVDDPYMADNDAPMSGAGSTKKAIDNPIYTRPELPLELEPRLQSRDTAKNKHGLFEKAALGPLVFELWADDAYLQRLYTTAGTAESRAYFIKAATRVKKGVHDKPVHDSSNKPIVTYWQARIVVTADDTQEFDVSAAMDPGRPGDLTDPGFAFRKGSNELVVHLNRALLQLGTTDECDKGQKDYEEVDTKKIKLRKGLTKKNDVVWVVRNDTSMSGTDVVAGWTHFPSGTNCHQRYGGIRGVAPTDDLVGVFRKAFSGSASGSEPIVGKGNAWTYTDHINLDPSKIAAAGREPIEVQAQTKEGEQQGLAGVIFSPSIVAGDSYVIEARTRTPFARDFGFIDHHPLPESWITRTGPLTVWRLLRVVESWRMPPKGTGGLPGSVGEEDPALADRSHPGVGRQMNFARLIEQGLMAFNEWVIDAPNGDGTEPHRNVDLDTYRSHFNGQPTADGFYNIADASKVTDEFVRWDHYRKILPPGIPANRKRVASKVIHELDKGKPSLDAAIGVRDAIDNWDTSHTNDRSTSSLGGAPIVNISSDTPDEYKGWVLGECMRLANSFMDTLLTQDNAPKNMKILRWPNLYWDRVWYDATPGNYQAAGLGVAGYCRGSGQAFFFSTQGNPDTFEHELGHSLHLIHFAAGSETNFGWKHHDHNYPHCLMGYNSGTFTVPLPSTKVGAAITIATSPREWFCPKCMLKMRGWDELLLPCNWEHPDVF